MTAPCAAKGKFQEQEHSLAGALGGLLPPDSLGWRRIIIGYGLAFTVLAVCGFVYFQSAQGSAVVKAREKDKETRDKEAEKKSQDDDREKKTEEIVSLYGPSVALIRFKEGEHSGGGTGFMIRPGVLVTNAHVIDDVLANQLENLLPFGHRRRKDAALGQGAVLRSQARPGDAGRRAESPSASISRATSASRAAWALPLSVAPASARSSSKTPSTPAT